MSSGIGGQSQEGKNTESLPQIYINIYIWSLTKFIDEHGRFQGSQQRTAPDMLDIKHFFFFNSEAV